MKLRGIFAKRRKVVPIKDRLERLSRRQKNGCLSWAGSVQKSGYGEILVGGKKRRVHRVAYEAVFGPIPDGMVICHICDNPLCINPRHLVAATQRENIRDASVKGRMKREVKTHCVAGHKFDSDNTYIYRGRRECKQCQLRRGREHYRRQIHKIPISNMKRTSGEEYGNRNY